VTSYRPGRWTGPRTVALVAVVLVFCAGAAAIGLRVDRRLDRLWDARVVLTGLGLLAAGTLVAPQAHWTLRMIGRRWLARDEPAPAETWIRFSRLSGAVVLATSLAVQGVLTGIAAPPPVRFALEVHDEARQRSGPIDTADEIRTIVAKRNGVAEGSASGLTIYPRAGDRQAACLRLRPDGDARIAPGACSD
jgi:hypothetical protein